MSSALIGLSGPITGTVRPGAVGEIQLPFAGGSNTYFAYPYDGESTIATGKIAMIVAFVPPSSVYVKEVMTDPGMTYQPAQ